MDIVAYTGMAPIEGTGCLLGRKEMRETALKCVGFVMEQKKAFRRSPTQVDGLCIWSGECSLKVQILDVHPRGYEAW